MSWLKDMNETKPVLWNRNFIQCCISYFLMNFSFYMLMPTMPVYLVEVLKINPSEVGVALSSYSIGVAVRPSFFRISGRLFFTQTVISLCLYGFCLYVYRLFVCNDGPDDNGCPFYSGWLYGDDFRFR